MTKIVLYQNLIGSGTYNLSRPIGDLSDHPEFQPYLSPAEMLEMGVFEGLFLNSCQDEYPANWFKNAQLREIDDQQIYRWLNGGNRGAHRQIVKNGGGDVTKRVAQRQTLLQWSRDPFPDKAWNSKIVRFLNHICPFNVMCVKAPQLEMI